MRDFIRDYNERYGATVLLTSHYMDDVAALCPRVIVIDQGRLIYDGDLRELVAPRPPRQAHHRPALDAGRRAPTWRGSGTVVSADAAQAVLVGARGAGERGGARRAGGAADRRPDDRGPAARGGHARAVPAAAARPRRDPGPGVQRARDRRSPPAPDAAPPSVAAELAVRRGVPDAAARRLRRGGRLPRRVPGLDPHHDHAAGDAGAVARGRRRRRRSGASISPVHRLLPGRAGGAAAHQQLDGLADVDGDPRRDAVREAAAADPPALRLRRRAPGGGADARAGRVADRRDPGRHGVAAAWCATIRGCWRSWLASLRRRLAADVLHRWC